MSRLSMDLDGLDVMTSKFLPTWRSSLDDRSWRSIFRPKRPYSALGLPNASARQQTSSPLKKKRKGYQRSAGLVDCRLAGFKVDTQFVIATLQSQLHNTTLCGTGKKTAKKNTRNQTRAADYVRACAVEKHMDMARGRNAHGHLIPVIFLRKFTGQMPKPWLSTNLMCGHTIWGTNVSQTGFIFLVVLEWKTDIGNGKSLPKIQYMKKW